MSTKRPYIVVNEFGLCSPWATLADCEADFDAAVNLLRQVQRASVRGYKREEGTP